MGEKEYFTSSSVRWLWKEIFIADGENDEFYDGGEKETRRIWRKFQKFENFTTSDQST